VLRPAVLEADKSFGNAQKNHHAHHGGLGRPGSEWWGEERGGGGKTIIEDLGRRSACSINKGYGGIKTT